MKFLSTGLADFVGAAASSACATACRVKQAYDQSGNGRHMAIGTLSAMLDFTFSVSGARAAMQCNNARATTLIIAATLGLVQPFTISAAAKTLATLQGTIYESNTSASAALEVDTSANTWATYAGGAGSFTAAAVETVWHADQAVLNGASSSHYIDGVLTSPGLNPGTGGSGTQQALCRDSFANVSNVIIMAVGVWSGDKSANNAAMNSNAHTNGGF